MHLSLQLPGLLSRFPESQIHCIMPLMLDTMADKVPQGTHGHFKTYSNDSKVSNVYDLLDSCVHIRNLAHSYCKAHRSALPHRTSYAELDISCIQSLSSDLWILTSEASCPYPAPAMGPSLVVMEALAVG